MLALIALAAIAFRLGAQGERLPQRLAEGTSDDLVSVAFGDARAVLSRSAYHQADSYFHGGVDMDCDCLSPDHAHEHDHSSAATEAPSPARDPWAWINSRIRAPEIERHLEGEHARELLPWFWASVRADPHNLEAWTAAWYTAAHLIRDRALAQRVLDEAKAANPQSAELWLTEGEFKYERGRGDLAAARLCFERAIELSSPDSQTREFAQRYLGDLAKQELKR